MKAPKAFALSDVGRNRETNEDSYCCEPRVGLYVVADGMGGHVAGEVASRLAVETLLRTFRNGGPPTGDPEEAAARMRRAVDEANDRILEQMETHAEQRGMGTTLVALLVSGSWAIIGHVGDSRAYLLRDGELRRLTEDHSWVHEQVRAGLLSAGDAERHPLRNVVTRALGSRLRVSLDLCRERILPGDVFLLCSDGLNSMVHDEEIRELLRRYQDEPERACRALVEAANAHGGEDNTTVVVVSWPAEPLAAEQVQN